MTTRTMSLQHLAMFGMTFTRVDLERRDDRTVWLSAMSDPPTVSRYTLTLARELTPPALARETWPPVGTGQYAAVRVPEGWVCGRWVCEGIRVTGWDLTVTALLDGPPVVRDAIDHWLWLPDVTSFLRAYAGAADPRLTAAVFADWIDEHAADGDPLRTGAETPAVFVARLRADEVQRICAGSSTPPRTRP